MKRIPYFLGGVLLISCGTHPITTITPTKDTRPQCLKDYERTWLNIERTCNYHSPEYNSEHCKFYTYALEQNRLACITIGIYPYPKPNPIY